LGSFAGSYLVGYLNGRTGSFGASYLFMAGSLFLSAIITVVVLKSGTDLKYDKPDGIDQALSKKILIE